VLELDACLWGLLQELAACVFADADAGTMCSKFLTNLEVKAEQALQDLWVTRREGVKRLLTAHAEYMLGEDAQRGVVATMYHKRHKLLKVPPVLTPWVCVRDGF
jgi:hypothetical protein